MRRVDRRTTGLVVLLALLSTTFVVTRIIIPFAPKRVEFANSILSNQAEPHYQYRVFKPVLGEAIGLALTPFVASPIVRHIAAYSLISLAAFLALFYTFGAFLRQLFSEKAVLIGLLLLQSVIPLSVTGFYMEGDFITTAFYSAGLLLMLLGKDIYLPLLVGVSAANREQVIFLVVIYGVWLVSLRRMNQKTAAVLTSCVIAYVLVVWGLRLYLGFRPTIYTPILNVQANSDVSNIFKLIAPVWIGQVGGFVVLSVMAFRRSHRFFQMALVSQIAYAALFFFGALMWETAKFLPAFLILIPMALQVLVDEFPQRLTEPALSDEERQAVMPVGLIRSDELRS